ncbi:MAG: PhoH family protein [Eubacteriales bacterium]
MGKDFAKKQIEVTSLQELTAIFGSFDENVKVIEEQTGVTIKAKDSTIQIEGDDEDVDIACQVLEQLKEMLRGNNAIEKDRIHYAIELAREGNAEMISKIMADVVLVTHRGKQIKSKTVRQQSYVNKMKENTIVFSVGPAGTGKTYLAMAMAVLALKNKEVTRIILTRPAVEAGEKLGFLPGDLQNKVDPYLRPLYDALYDMMGADKYQALSEKGIIEVAPMAYMRGRTLNDAFVILDEAQNTTKEQMKMFLTRLGEGSKMVVTGDITQRDLPDGKVSGLSDAIEVLKDVKDIGIVFLTAQDVVRHNLVRNIVKAYDKREKKEQYKSSKAKKN